MASNIQRGPRRMDASDWVRMKRIRGMNFFDAKKSVENPPFLLEAKTGRRVYTEFGTSNIRLPASFYTDLVASNAGDYVLESGGPGNKRLQANYVCDCSTQDPVKHNGICIRCVYDNNERGSAVGGGFSGVDGGRSGGIPRGTSGRISGGGSGTIVIGAATFNFGGVTYTTKDVTAWSNDILQAFETQVLRSGRYSTGTVIRFGALPQTAFTRVAGSYSAVTNILAVAARNGDTIDLTRINVAANEALLFPTSLGTTFTLKNRTVSKTITSDSNNDTLVDGVVIPLDSTYTVGSYTITVYANASSLSGVQSSPESLLPETSFQAFNYTAYVGVTMPPVTQIAQVIGTETIDFLLPTIHYPFISSPTWTVNGTSIFFSCIVEEGAQPGSYPVSLTVTTGGPKLLIVEYNIVIDYGTVEIQPVPDSDGSAATDP